MSSLAFKTQQFSANLKTIAFESILLFCEDLHDVSCALAPMDAAANP